MKARINGQEYEFTANETILEVARRNGIFIPTLCEMHDIRHAPGTCRVCLVGIQREGEPEPVYVTACDTPMVDGVQIFTRTPHVQELRRRQVELILDEHNQDCATCSRHGHCELLDVASVVGMSHRHFSSCQFEPTPPVPQANHSAIVYDATRCIRCLRCVAVCREVQAIDALEFIGRGQQATIALKGGNSRRESDCVSCGQCVMVCPTGALAERDETRTVMDYLVDPDIVTVFQIAPAIRVGLGEAFGLPPGTNVEGQVVAALRAIGADVILDTNFAADLVIMEEGHEVLGRVRQHEGTTFTSCCPGWVDYAEKHHPDILPMMSSTRSPQACLGSLAKSWLPTRMGIDPARVRVVSVMPCTAKKQEAARPQLGRNGVPDVDVVLTIREFARLLRREGVDLAALEPSAFDDPLMSEYSMYAGLRTTMSLWDPSACSTLREYFMLNTGSAPLEQLFPNVRLPVPVGASASRWLLRMPILRIWLLSFSGRRLAKVPSESAVTPSRYLSASNRGKAPRSKASPTDAS